MLHCSNPELICRRRFNFQGFVDVAGRRNRRSRPALRRELPLDRKSGRWASTPRGYPSERSARLSACRDRKLRVGRPNFWSSADGDWPRRSGRRPVSDVRSVAGRPGPGRRAPAERRSGRIAASSGFEVHDVEAWREHYARRTLLGCVYLAVVFQTIATRRARGASGLPPTRADLYG